MELGWKQAGKFTAIPTSAWVHPGTTKLVRIEQSQGWPVPVPTLHVKSYIGYANLWLYELSVSLAGALPEGWTVQWKFSDGSTSTQKEFTHVVVGGNSQSVTVKLQRGRDVLTGGRSINFVENLPAASIKNTADLHRYLNAMTNANPAELSEPVLRGYLQFFQAVEQEPLMSRLAAAWLKKNPDLGDPFWLPVQLSRLRYLAQNEPARALAELRGLPNHTRSKYAAVLDLFELDLLVFNLNDASAVTRATEISQRDPKSDTARLALVRAGDYFRLQGRSAEAITRYQQAQRSVVEDSEGRKLPAQDQAFSMTLEDLLSRNEAVVAEQKLTEWEARHPMAKLDSDFLIWRGRVLLARGRQREALAEIESFEKLLPESPYQIDAAYYRAQALFALGRQAEARLIWAEIAKQYPQHPLAISSLELSTKK
ncbi:MAG: tetratricopeptide repeat protein [Verrucomicrobiota bacterium]